MESQRGYTLLEIVVAFSILSLSLAALAESFRLSSRRTERARHLSEAVLVAQSVRERVGGDIALMPGVRSEVQGACRWTADIAFDENSPVVEQLALRGYRVGIEARCGTGEAERAARLDIIELGAAAP